MKKSDKGAKLKKHIKNFFTKNLTIKILSLVFAVLLWGYVLMAQDPVRTKRIDDVNIIYEGESELLTRNLVIANLDEEIVNTISVLVDTQLTKYADLSAANITATVNMKTILSPGTYTMPVTVTTNEGTVRNTSISPSTVTIKVDNLVTKTVPVVSQVSGDIGTNYWSGTPVLASNEVAITGPSEYVSEVSKAICDVNLTGRTESFDEAVELVLVKNDGSVVSKSLLTGIIPSVGVSVEVLRKATITIDVPKALTGVEELPSNYEIIKAEAVPAQITVVGSEEDIKALTAVSLPPISVAGEKENIEKAVSITLPEGIRAIEGTDVMVYVMIAEKQETVTYPAKTIGMVGLDSGLRATVLPMSTSVTVTGRRTLMNGFTASDFKLYVDLTDLAAGEYECPVMVEFAKSEYTELAANITDAKVKVTIKEN